MNKLPPNLVLPGIIGFFIAIFVLAVFFTGITVIQPGEVALIKNNLFGTETLKLSNGTDVHLPFGITQVYKIDKKVQSIEMTGDPKRGDRYGDDSVQVKTNDGSNVNVDVTVQYRIITDQVDDLIKVVGRGGRYKGEKIKYFESINIIRSYARSIVRDELGTLSVTQIAEPGERNNRVDDAKKRMNKEIKKYSLVVDMLSATNPRFNSQYQNMINERKGAEQDVRNEIEAQVTALTEQAMKRAESERQKKIAIRKSEGELNAIKISASAEAEKIVREAEGISYSKKKEGDRILAIAINEAKAIEVEGLARAEGIKKLADAYEKGGDALVREALSEKFKGVKVEGRPYSISSNIDRFLIEKAATYKSATSGKGGMK
jgi:regulator of protease activity HflC (stomatin/prohibitin superfamily)